MKVKQINDSESLLIKNKRSYYSMDMVYVLWLLWIQIVFVMERRGLIYDLFSAYSTRCQEKRNQKVSLLENLNIQAM